MHNLISSSKKKDYNSRILEMFNEFKELLLIAQQALMNEHVQSTGVNNGL